MIAKGGIPWEIKLLCPYWQRWQRGMTSKRNGLRKGGKAVKPPYTLGVEETFRTVLWGREQGLPLKFEIVGSRKHT